MSDEIEQRLINVGVVWTNGINYEVCRSEMYGVPKYNKW